MCGLIEIERQEFHSISIGEDIWKKIDKPLSLIDLLKCEQFKQNIKTYEYEALKLKEYDNIHNKKGT